MTTTCVAVLTVLVFSQPMYAGEVPGLDKSVTINARELPVDRFLSNLFGHIGVPVVIDPKVVGVVNGTWDDSVGVLLEKATRSFQLVTYFDGATAYVYKDSDLSQQIMPVRSAVAKDIIQYASSMSLVDTRNRLDHVGRNGLRVVGTPRFVEQIKSASRSFRSKEPKYTPLVVEKLFYLKHAWAQDSIKEIGGQSVEVKGIVSTLTDLLMDAPIGETLTPMATSTDLTRMQPQTSQTMPLSSGSGDMAALRPQASSSSLVRRTTQTKIDANDVRIVAVPRLNAVLIRDLESRMDSYQGLIDSLDVEPYMLEIEATIIDLNSDKSQELGVNWRAQGDNFNEALVGSGTASDLGLRPDTQITPSGAGGILSLALGNERAKFLARIRALEQSGDAEIISKPHVVTLANVEAVLDTTQSFFARVQAQEDAALFKITVGTTLRVTPHVYRDNGETRIKLLINIQDGATSDATVDSIPVIGQSTISTQAIVKAGDSLLIGGMVRESKRSGESKVPFFGNIPGLGNLFRTRTSGGSKVERLFLITPRLAYRQGFEKRMDGPVLQGQVEDILNSSSVRLADTKKLLGAKRDQNTDTAIVVDNAASRPVKPVFSVEYQATPTIASAAVPVSMDVSQTDRVAQIKQSLRIPVQQQPPVTTTVVVQSKSVEPIAVDDDEAWIEVRGKSREPAQVDDERWLSDRGEENAFEVAEEEQWLAISSTSGEQQDTIQPTSFSVRGGVQGIESSGISKPIPDQSWQEVGK